MMEVLLTILKKLLPCMFLNKHIIIFPQKTIFSMGSTFWEWGNHWWQINHVQFVILMGY